MHPIERLRAVARASSISPTLAVQETATAMAAVANDPFALVTAARRMIDRHPAAAPLWWFASRVLTAADPRAEARRAAEEIGEDRTAVELAHALPDGATVTVLGWPEVVAAALVRRGDVEVRVVDVHGEGSAFASRLQRYDIAAIDVPPEAVGAVAASSELVLLEAEAMGPTAVLARSGSRAAAAVARHAGVAVWAAAGVGRALPAQMWDALVRRAGLEDEPWDADDELVPLDLVDQVATPRGICSVTDALYDIDCPVAPELLVDRRDPG
ncbi:MAG TPA: hypothetical protein VF183_11570 [Acidimicrobiales bacterium]